MYWSSPVRSEWATKPKEALREVCPTPDTWSAASAGGAAERTIAAAATTQSVFFITISVADLGDRS
jgi:hypothetical protein